MKNKFPTTICVISIVLIIVDVICGFFVENVLFNLILDVVLAVTSLFAAILIVKFMIKNR